MQSQPQGSLLKELVRLVSFGGGTSSAAMLCGERCRQNDVCLRCCYLGLKVGLDSLQIVRRDCAKHVMNDFDFLRGSTLASPFQTGCTLGVRNWTGVLEANALGGSVMCRTFANSTRSAFLLKLRGPHLANVAHPPIFESFVMCAAVRCTFPFLYDVLLDELHQWDMGV